MAADFFLQEFETMEFGMWTTENFGPPQCTHSNSVMWPFHRLWEVAKIVTLVLSGKEAFIDDKMTNVISSSCKGDSPNLFLIFAF